MQHRTLGCGFSFTTCRRLSPFVMLALLLVVGLIVTGHAFLQNGPGRRGNQKDAAFSSSARPELDSKCGLSNTLRSKEGDDDGEGGIEAREKEFQELLNSMLGEAKENIQKKDIDMGSAEAMMLALSEAKKLNLTEEEAAEEERKAVEEFSESFMDFIDGMVKIDGDDESESLSFADAFGGAPQPAGTEGPELENLELPSGPLSMSEALTMITPLRNTLSKAEWDETVELLEDVSPEERFDICSFMVRARMRPIEEDE